MKGKGGEADQEHVISVTVHKISFDKRGLYLKKKKSLKDIAWEISSDSVLTFKNAICSLLPPMGRDSYGGPSLWNI